MKFSKSITKFALLLISSFLFLNCSSDDDNDDSFNSSDGFIIANVEGSSFEALSDNSSDLVVASKIEQRDQTVLLIQGVNNRIKSIVLSVVEYEGSGTYSFSIDGPPNGTIAQYTNEERAWSTANENGGSGTILVTTDNDDEISGSFEFVGIEVGNESTRTVTNGSFRVKFSNQ
jgi:hypothetical protein